MQGGVIVDPKVIPVHSRAVYVPVYKDVREAERNRRPIFVYGDVNVYGHVNEGSSDHFKSKFRDNVDKGEGMKAQSKVIGRPVWIYLAIVLGLFFAMASVLSGASADNSSSATARWWRGNLHSHTVWSDGDVE